MKTIRIQNRDREIFRFIYENLYVTIPQVHRAVFKDRDPITSTVRLFQLHHGEYLKKLKYGRTLLKLTRRALNEILDTPFYINKNRYVRQKVRTYQIGHDLGVIDAKIILKESPIISNWVPALDLFSYQYKEFYGDRIPKIPDAVFDLKVGDKILKTALEYEMTQKESMRYRMILERYYTAKKVDLLLYIARTSQLKKKLLEIGKEKLKELGERGVTNQNILYVTTLDEFREKGLESLFQGVTEKTFSFKGLEDKVPKTPTPTPSIPQSIPQCGA